MLLLGLKFSTGGQIVETQRQPRLGKSSRPGEGSFEHVKLGIHAGGGGGGRRRRRPGTT